MALRTRREFLWQAGLGAAALSASPTWTLPATRRREERDLLAFARRILASPLEDGLHLLGRCAREGWTRDDLLGGIYVAGALEVEPVLGGISHCMMVVPSAGLLADASPPEEAMLPVLFNLADLKRSQARDRSGGDFVLPPAPASDLSPREAGPALREALEAWDPEASDRAAVAAARVDDLDAVFENLWPLGVHDFHNIGHKVIFTAHAYRTLRRAGRSAAEPVFRSLAVGLRFGKDADRVGFEENRARAAAVPAVPAEPRRAPQASREILRELRGATPARASSAALESLQEGVAPDSIWDGIRLAAAELHLRNPGLLAVHALTAANAMHFAASTTRREETRRLMLLQAAAWIPTYREALRRRFDHPRHFHIDELEPGAPHPAPRILEIEDAEAAFRSALALASTPQGARELREAARRQVLRKGDESHYYKYAAAVAEEHAKTDPAWAPRLLAASLSYLPASDAPDTAVSRTWLDGGYRG